MPADRWVAIDFETATRQATSACALGVAVVEDADVVATHAWLIRPPFNEYEFRNTMIHGMSSEDTELAPEFDEVWWEVSALIDGSPLIAHNAQFDIRVLRALIETRELNAPNLEYACTVSMARAAMHELPRHTLDVVCGHCGIGLRHHDAASDAEACARVALACAERAGVNSITYALEALGVGTKTLR